jgi:CheY-like chemotaxis protein
MNKEVNILLVEDEEIDVMDITRFLQRLPVKYQLHLARNGEEAVEMLNGHGTLPEGVLPDLVLVDLNMPRMNGFELLTAITTSHKWGPMEVYIITTSSDPVDKSAAKALNVKGYIEKPVSLKNPNNLEAIESITSFLTGLVNK